MFTGKRVLVGITAGIAAYKTILLVRALKKEGAEVKVVLTPNAHEFVTPLTLATLSGNPVVSDFTEDAHSGEWTNHVELGMWADVMVIAPATANTLSKMVNGTADNFLMATYLSAKCLVAIAPAMDLDMYKHPSTTENLAKLESFGHTIVPAGDGELASGLIGKGRMAEPEDIMEYLRDILFPPTPLKGKKILITAGPTYEPIDPVRFLGNRSTGKMGYRLAEEAARLGMDVVLVSGPTHEKLDTSSVQLIPVRTASEMFEACTALQEDMDVIIMSAAVADYTPLTVSDQKVKKKGGNWSLELTRTKDILAHLGEHKADGQILVGFALETQNEEENAKSKLKRKKLDYIVLNSLNDQGAGFAGETNRVSIIDENNNISKFELKSKSEVAKDILNQLIKHYERI